MTLLLSTVTAEAAWISQDSLLPANGKPWGYASKLLVVPGKLVAGISCDDLGCGIGFIMAAWQHPDIEVLPQKLPELFLTWSEAHRHKTLIAIFAGYSPRQMRVIAYCARHDSGMKPQQISDGHFGTPDGNPDFPGYEDCYGLADAAGNGTLVELFHRDLGLHIAGVARGGGYGKTGPLIGGTMQTARIELKGITITDGVDLDRTMVKWKQGEAAA